MEFEQEHVGFIKMGTEINLKHFGQKKKQKLNILEDEMKQHTIFTRNPNYIH